MTRRFVLFLALLLPLQFAWAGAAAYCAHETAPAETRHVGHHEHAHHADADASPGKLAADNDCGTCHAAGAAVLAAAVALPASIAETAPAVPHAQRRVPSALSGAPDRPQWPRLA